MHHTVIPARMPSMESNTRFSLFVTELYLRNRVSDHYVSASSRPTGLRLSHGESMIQLPSLLLNASVLPCGTRNLTISAYLCWHLAARSMTSQHNAPSKSLYCTLSAVDVILSLLTFFINTSRYTSTTTSIYARAARS